MDSSPRRRKKLWYTAAAVGLVGAAGLAAVAVVQADTPGTNPAARAAPPGASERLSGRPAYDGDEETRGGKDGSHHGGVIEVPCDPDDLIQALVRANARGGTTLELSKDCTYELTAHQDNGYVDGLPLIEQPIEIKGNGATIGRDAAAVPFRILHVGTGGDLTLHDLAVRYGDARDGVGGGGLLVDAGGRATVERTVFAHNQTDEEGGAIANYGITRIHGDLHGKDGLNGVEDKDGVGSDSMKGIHDNAAEDGGGAIFNAGHLAVKDTTLRYNTTAGLGGAVASVGTASLVNSRVENNNAANAGGGITGLFALTTIEDSYIANNTAGAGAGLDSFLSMTYLKRTNVVQNRSSGIGGGLYSFASEVAVDDSKINANSVAGQDGSGGGIIAVVGSDVTLHHSEVDLNKAFGELSAGGGIHSINSDFRLTHSTVNRNLSTEPPGGFLKDGGTAEVDDDSEIAGNRPSNCVDGGDPVENCFG